MKKILKRNAQKIFLKKLYKKKTYMKIHLKVSGYQMNMTETTPTLIQRMTLLDQLTMQKVIDMQRMYHK